MIRAKSQQVQTLTVYQVSEMLGLSRVETEDFLGQHHIPLAVIDEPDSGPRGSIIRSSKR
jgi:hypothetical protein